MALGKQIGNSRQRHTVNKALAIGNAKKFFFLSLPLTLQATKMQGQVQEFNVKAIIFQTIDMP